MHSIWPLTMCFYVTFLLKKESKIKKQGEEEQWWLTSYPGFTDEKSEAEKDKGMHGQGGKRGPPSLGTWVSTDWHLSVSATLLHAPWGSHLPPPRPSSEEKLPHLTARQKRRVLRSDSGMPGPSSVYHLYWSGNTHLIAEKAGLLLLL